MPKFKISVEREVETHFKISADECALIASALAEMANNVLTDEMQVRLRNLARVFEGAIK